jgi:hypothetical protein
MTITHEQLLGLNGKRVTCKIYDTRITDGKILVDPGGRVFVCQNIKWGEQAADLLGYKHSWLISTPILKYEMDKRGCTNIQLLKEQIDFLKCEIGQKVISKKYGEGVIIDKDYYDNTFQVQFDVGTRWYSQNGKEYGGEDILSLPEKVSETQGETLQKLPEIDFTKFPVGTKVVFKGDIYEIRHIDRENRFKRPIVLSNSSFSHIGADGKIEEADQFRSLFLLSEFTGEPQIIEEKTGYWVNVYTKGAGRSHRSEEDAKSCARKGETDSGKYLRTQFIETGTKKYKITINGKEEIK